MVLNFYDSMFTFEVSKNGSPLVYFLKTCTFFISLRRKLNKHTSTNIHYFIPNKISYFFVSKQVEKLRVCLISP